MRPELSYTLHVSDPRGEARFGRYSRFRVRARAFIFALTRAERNFLFPTARLREAFWCEAASKESVARELCYAVDVADLLRVDIQTLCDRR